MTSLVRALARGGCGGGCRGLFRLVLGGGSGGCGGVGGWFGGFGRGGDGEVRGGLLACGGPSCGIDGGDDLLCCIHVVMVSVCGTWEGIEVSS